MAQVLMYDDNSVINKFFVHDGIVHKFAITGKYLGKEPIKNCVEVLTTTLPPKKVDIVSILYGNNDSEVALQMGNKFKRLNFNTSVSDLIAYCNKLQFCLLTSTTQYKINDKSYTKTIYVFSDGVLANTIFSKVG